MSQLLVTILAMGLGGGFGCSSGSKSGSGEAPRGGPSQGADGSRKEGVGTDKGAKSTPVALDPPEALPGKIQVKSFHILVRDGDKGYSGYCVASVKKPNLPPEMLESVEVVSGPCPATLKINSQSATMAYVCPVREAGDGSKQQTVLYSILNTDFGFKNIRDVGSEIVDVFCAQ